MIMAVVEALFSNAIYGFDSLVVSLIVRWRGKSGVYRHY
jgi:hypothetical protein